MKKTIITACLVLPTIIAAIVIYDRTTFHSEEIFIQEFTSDGFRIALRGELQIRRKLFVALSPDVNHKCKLAIQTAIMDSKLKDIHYDGLWFQKKILRAIMKETKFSEIKFIDFKIKRIYYPESIFESTGIDSIKYFIINYTFAGKTQVSPVFYYMKMSKLNK